MIVHGSQYVPRLRSLPFDHRHCNFLHYAAAGALGSAVEVMPDTEIVGAQPDSAVAAKAPHIVAAAQVDIYFANRLLHR